MKKYRAIEDFAVTAMDGIEWIREGSEIWAAGGNRLGVQTGKDDKEFVWWINIDPVQQVAELIAGLLKSGKIIDKEEE
ncbi:hypothetical protein [Megamonas hypermegale]|uniref:hypothetical protein n=1 Tax=Megamonas hypermegale TaxID=158847 RepID=UPI0026EA2936|nr:hypothetical protein [Megamonas hypermegale]